MCCCCCHCWCCCHCLSGQQQQGCRYQRFLPPLPQHLLPSRLMQCTPRAPVESSRTRLLGRGRSFRIGQERGLADCASLCYQGGEAPISDGARLPFKSFAPRLAALCGRHRCVLRIHIPVAQHSPCQEQTGNTQTAGTASLSLCPLTGTVGGKGTVFMACLGHAGTQGIHGWSLRKHSR